MIYAGDERRQTLSGVCNLSPTDFEMTSLDVLSFLHQRIGFGLWMVTRVQGDDWIILEARDFDFDVLPGMVFHWGDSLCMAMIQGRAPRIAPQVSEHKALAEVKLTRDLLIQAYIGVPLQLSNGTLFGTLCAFDREPQAQTIVKELKMVELFAAMLGKLAEGELAGLEKARQQERAMVSDSDDALTGLVGRFGWERLCQLEENRCRRYGSPAAVVSVNLDGLKLINAEMGQPAGDRHLKRAADSIRSACRSDDIVARTGGDQFGILLIDCSESEVNSAVSRISEALHHAQIPASIGSARRDPSLGLEMAIANADATMVVRKTLRRQAA